MIKSYMQPLRDEADAKRQMFKENIDSTQFGSIDKVHRYHWSTVDQPGVLKHIHKDELLIDDTYQRDPITTKITEITARWSWIAAGVLSIGQRGDKYYVIDGQHRLLAAKRRSDITTLPCIVFQTQTIEEEAKGFLHVNSNRKPVAAFEKHKAETVIKDPIVLQVEQVLKDVGIRLTKTCSRPRDVKAINLLKAQCGRNRAQFTTIMQCAATVCHDTAVSVNLLKLFWYLHENIDIPNGLGNERLVARLEQLGGRALELAIQHARGVAPNPTPRFIAEGVMSAINKRLRDKFKLKESEKA